MALDFIGIVVADMKTTLDFYRCLGLEFDDETQDHVEARLPSGLRIGFDTQELVRGFDPSWSAPAGSPRISLAFLCDGPSEVDSRYTDLVRAGYAGHKEPWDAFWGQRYAQLRDPDGNGVDLFAPL